MPYRLTWEPFGVYREYFGDVTVAERRASLDAICADPRFDSLQYAITDFLAVRSYEASPVTTAEIAALHIGPLLTNPRMLIAAVTDRPDVLASIEDFKRFGFTSAPYRAFATLAEARAWVDPGRPGQGR